MYTRSPAPVREMLLDAAEQQLATYGVARASIRNIVKAAGANLGAVNYHFGSKDNLVAEVFLRRIRPVDEKRIACLDALEKAAGDGPLKLEDVLEAFIRPLVESEDAEGKQTIIFRLLDRAYHEADPGVRDLMAKVFYDVAKRFNAAILRAIPGMTPNERFWGVMFVVGAIHHALDVWSNWEELPPIPLDEKPDLLDHETFIQRAIAFTAAGLRAQCLTTTHKDILP